MNNPHMPDISWLSAALTDALGVRTDTPFEAWIETDGRIRCQACVTREITRALSDPQSELAPLLLGALLRQFEFLVVEVK